MNRVDGSEKPAGYRVALLDPRRQAIAQGDRLGPCTLGIEVTVPALAAACGLGNIDPQHTRGGDGRAAIEAALGWPLPAPGSTLVTIRPDLDSVGAIAVLAMRADGAVIHDVARRRIGEIARADRHDRGDWPGPRPAASLFAEPSPLAPLALAVADAGLSLPERVTVLRHWLCDGEVPPAYSSKAAAEHRGFAAALAQRALRVRPLARGRIAAVVGERPEALRLGYCFAPIVIALNPIFRLNGGPPHRKVTIAQYRAGYADFLALRDQLAGWEPGWGGSPTILGSPQGQASQQSLCTLARAVRRTLQRSAQVRIGQ